MNCLRFFRILPPIDEVKEKKTLFKELKDAVDRGRTIVNELSNDLTLCSADVEKEHKRYLKTRDPSVKSNIRQLMTLQTQIGLHLKEAQERLVDSELSYNQVRFNLVNLQEAKNAEKVVKLLKKLDVNADSVSKSVRAYGDYLSDTQRAADGTKPYSGGLTTTMISDEDFDARLAELETRSLRAVLDPIPERTVTSTHATDTNIHEDIQSFLSNDDTGDTIALDYEEEEEEEMRL